MAASETSQRRNCERIIELEKQLEVQKSTISNLKKVIEQKDELLNATNDKVLDLEQKKTDIEEALVNLTIDEPGKYRKILIFSPENLCLIFCTIKLTNL